MKKVIFLLLLLCSTVSFAQVHTVYCEMIGSGSLSGKSIKISFDFGEQGYYYKASDDNQIVDEEGKVIDFLSMIPALNYMADRGWKLHTAYSSAIKGQGGAETYRYILTKDLAPDESIMNGIILLGKYKEQERVQKERLRERQEKQKGTWDDVYK